MEKKIQIDNIKTWGLGYEEKPVLMAGPCSAETEEQVLETAKDLSQRGVKIFRAGIWKPRTRPNSFEGVGSKGLAWLKTVRQEMGMLTTTEVANVKHVYECLKAGVDILWIGARSSANPFAMQEIAEALKGVDIPVFVKNPINPDVELWIGAIERLHQAGIRKIGAIHRGFSSFDQSLYRNTPQWQIPIELKRRIPTMPMICDPSHIGGKRDLLLSISQKAMDLDFDGLMIESHRQPDEAWSDAKQQITPEKLSHLIGQLVMRDAQPAGVSLTTLEELRFNIDRYDKELMEIFEKRMKESQAIGRYKKENKMTILQAGRWDEVLQKSIILGEKHQLSALFVERVFKAIHQESINKQNAILNG
jgi:chorismate mutase